MTKSNPTVKTLTTELAELKSTVAVLATAVTQITELLTNPTETVPATTKAAKSKNKTRKSNGNKWFSKPNGSKVWKLMKDQGSTDKNKEVWAVEKAKKTPLKLIQANGNERTWNVVAS